MLIRIWETEVHEDCLSDYHTFAQTFSHPMFCSAEGCLGVLFLSADKTQAVHSLWKDAESIRQFALSDIYKHTSSGLIASGILRGRQSVQLYQLTGGNFLIEKMQTYSDPYKR